MRRAEPQTFTVAEAAAGERLDKVLAQHLSLSRREVVFLLENGKVRLDGRPVSPGTKGRLLSAGQRLSVAPFQTKAAARVRPAPELPLAVLFEGADFVVVDKPAGQAVFPHHPDERGTLLNAVVARYPELQGVGEGGLQSGVVHRLDRDTSGALAVATKEAAWQRLRAAFEKRRVRKTYRALVRGRLEGRGREEVTLYVARHRPAYVRVAAGERAEASGARRCALEWRTLEAFTDASLLEVELETGFLHQIRVMLAHKGHPVLGDALYGNAALAPRQLLHASRLELSGASVNSPDPADFAAALAALREAG